jgi:protease-4
MPPSSYLMITGPASSALFLKGTFDKLGIRPNIDRIGDYKSAAETFTETERTPASREMAGWLLDDIYERFVDAIAEARGLGEDTVRMHIDYGLFAPRSALAAGLIDGIRNWDEISGRLEAEGITLLPAREYIRVRELNAPAFSSRRIAVVHAGGTIVMGESGFDATFGQTVGAETVIRELRRVREEEGIKAVVLRVDSPGGDGIAGAMISREVEITAAVKPVVVSMSDVAASGGYEISYRADRIVALPGSITGSIGSFTGKLNVRGFYDRIGFTKDEMGTGAKSLMNSNYRDYTSAEWEVLREEHRAFYRHWIEDIARFRDMEVTRVDSIAQGRVWTGRQARERGLVDEEGGFNRALEIACELAGIEDPDDAAIMHLPTRLSILQRILSGGYLEHTAAYLIHYTLFRHPSGSRAFSPQHYYPYRLEP